MNVLEAVEFVLVGGVCLFFASIFIAQTYLIRKKKKDLLK